VSFRHFETSLFRLKTMISAIPNGSSVQPRATFNIAQSAHGDFPPQDHQPLPSPAGFAYASRSKACRAGDRSGWIYRHLPPQSRHLSSSSTGSMVTTQQMQTAAGANGLLLIRCLPFELDYQSSFSSTHISVLFYLTS